MLSHEILLGAKYQSWICAVLWLYDYRVLL